MELTPFWFLTRWRFDFAITHIFDRPCQSTLRTRLTSPEWVNKRYANPPPPCKPRFLGQQPYLLYSPTVLSLFKGRPKEWRTPELHAASLTCVLPWVLEAVGVECVCLSIGLCGQGVGRHGGGGEGGGAHGAVDGRLARPRRRWY